MQVKKLKAELKSIVASLVSTCGSEEYENKAVAQYRERML